MAGDAGITTHDALRALYAAPKERTLRKQLDFLDVHCRRFVGLSPFVVLSTVGAQGLVDEGADALAAVGGRPARGTQCLADDGGDAARQTGMDGPMETQAEMARRYAPDL